MPHMVSLRTAKAVVSRRRSYGIENAEKLQSELLESDINDN